MVSAPDIRADRRLLVPGPLPPLSHLGATLFRYSAHAALRYALYQLDQPTPEVAPIRFVSLRPYWDVPELRRFLGDGATSSELLGALVDPGGVAGAPLPRRLAGVLWFHRRRLRLFRWPRGRPAKAAPGCQPVGPAAAARAELSALLPGLGEALLGELLAALDRRQKRSRGRFEGPVQSHQASRFLAARKTDLSRLGPPDPATPSWREAPPELSGQPPAIPSLPSHRLRGGFREHYRFVADRLRPYFVSLGRQARAAGLLTAEDDVFFLPLDLIGDLEAETKPDWLEGAIASNRAEREALTDRRAPADTMGNVEPSPPPSTEPELASLTPLE